MGKHQYHTHEKCLSVEVVKVTDSAGIYLHIYAVFH